MAELAVPIPMTPRTFYTDTALSQNKAKMDAIGKTFYKEIKQAETLTKVPGSLILSLIFTESGGRPAVVSSANAVGLMQMKTQTANDIIYWENKAGRLSAEELAILKKHLGERVNGPLNKSTCRIKSKRTTTRVTSL
jgi:soluble lytic murein transglycosylase-like protein